jgi:hypothetical protein
VGASPTTDGRAREKVQIAATAERARCAWIATFDERFRSPTIPARLI